MRRKGKRGQSRGEGVGDDESNSKTFRDVDVEGIAKPGARCWTHVSRVSKERLSGATVAVALDSK